LKPPISSSRNITLASVGSHDTDTVSPAIRLPPTIETGLSGSRSWTPTMASATPQTFCGSVISASTVCSAV
jgi:hypothetical protein